MKPAPAVALQMTGERLGGAAAEIERLKAALEEAKEQQEWALAHVVQAKEAEKEGLQAQLLCA
jgi:hypothetical protein